MTTNSQYRKICKLDPKCQTQTLLMMSIIYTALSAKMINLKEINEITIGKQITVLLTFP